MEKELEVSVVLPCLNEEASVGLCVNRIKEVFAKEEICGEIIVADNGSLDRSREVASSCGAKVVVEQRKGYGAAYLRGLSEAKGKYIIIGDSDNTYDFGDIPKFLEALRSGYDFVMGSRFRGGIQKGAMSFSHRYIGNPILSGLCRLFFHTSLSDIHCGMRAFTREAYLKMKLMTLGMEFATEMVVSALTTNLKTYEIPINYHPRAGESKLSPLTDAWRHIRFMLLYCPVWLYFIPGIIGFILGITLLLVLYKGPFLFLGHRWDAHLMVFASVLCIFSYQILNLGVYAHTYAIRQGFLKYDPLTLFFQRHFNLERGIVLGGAILLMGIGINIFIFGEWFSKHFGALSRIREAILAMTMLVIGLHTIFSSFFISLLFIERKSSSC
ncbi:MAG: glycosyltransferase [Candidatus Omnitrophica bacterium]|nr:glycosyltransferase [Candidatus Omnitrophota bacterium]